MLVSLRFGWTLAEVYGRLAERPPPDTPSSSQRLFLSELNPSPNVRMWVAAKRLVYLTKSLSPAPTVGSDRAEQRPVPDPIIPPSCVEDLLQSMERRMRGAGRLAKAEDVYGDLNEWSRDVWATLDAEDPLLAEAAVLGARLADTFWQWPYPGSGSRRSSRGIWYNLLKPQRTTAIIRQVRLVEGRLPRHVGPMLRHSLWEWGIAGELGRDESGRLTIDRRFRYNLRSLNWVRRHRRRRMAVAPGTPPQLTLEEERALWRRLRNQMFTWEHLVFNRALAHLLRPSDWRQVRWLSLALYVAATLVITGGGALLLAWSIRLLTHFLGVLLPFLATPTEFKDQLTLATTVVAILAFLATQFRRSLVRLRHLYDSIYDWVMMRKLQQRGLRSWDGRDKPWRWIWLQRLLRGED